MAALAFTPIPAEQRTNPQPVGVLNCRFYTEDNPEHAEALAYYKESVQFWGDHSEFIVDTLSMYGEEIEAGRARPSGPLPVRRKKGERSKYVQKSWRAYNNKYLEHRRAWDLYKTYGTAVIPAALLYRARREREAQPLAA
jgi:hypothetical protein